MNSRVKNVGCCLGLACCVLLGLFSQLFVFAVFKGKLTAVMTFSEAGHQQLFSQSPLYYQYYPKSKGLFSASDYQDLASTFRDKSSIPDAYWFLLSSNTPLLSSETQRLGPDLFVDNPLSMPGSAPLVVLCYLVFMCCFFLLCPACLFLPQDYSAHLCVLAHEHQPLGAVIKFSMAMLLRAELVSLTVSLFVYLAIASWLNSLAITNPWLTNLMSGIWTIFCLHLLHFIANAILKPIHQARLQTR
ncbi:MAG: hypothetical protein VXY77_03070 [Pseudomonadota bacterium]|nr:hypothetical protein [Pseudomonadota bacterium]